MAKIYLASSWRNREQPTMVDLLRAAGHDVYDFRNPPGGIQNGFRWSEIDEDWQDWDAATYRRNLVGPLAQQGFNSDFSAMQWADVGVLLLPCGRSAHLELGWMAGAGKFTIIVTNDGEEPELMNLLASSICVSSDELLAVLADYDRAGGPPLASYQRQVHRWMLKCFGGQITADRMERNHRFLEEALELVQANGCTQSEARQLVDYVFGRPVGDPDQEVGGVMVTLAALCTASGLEMQAAGERELSRIWTKVEQIRAKQAAKPKHSPLPMAVDAPAIEFLGENARG